LTHRLLVVAVILAVSVASTAPASAASFDIHIIGGAPSPSTITIDPGDVIVFVNDDGVSHTIFAQGRPQDDPIPPGGRSNEFGPFEAGGDQAQFAYQVDASGPSGLIVLRGTAATIATTAPPTTSLAPPVTDAST
jgi:plastocyanin